MKPMHPVHPIEPDQLFSLANGELTAAEERPLRSHLGECEECRAAFDAVSDIQAQAEALRPPSPDALLQEKIWSNLAEDAARAAEKAQRRQALSLFGSVIRFRFAAAAALIVAGPLLVILYMTHLNDGETVNEPVSGQGVVATPRPLPDHEPASTAPPRSASKPEDAERPVPGAPTKSPHKAAHPAATATRLACGAAILDQRGRVTRILDAPDSAVLKLSSGRIALRVPKLPPSGRLEVVTPDARVRVKGTRFSVSRRDNSGTVVEVTEGVVQVSPQGRNRAPITLSAGAREVVLGEAAYLEQLRDQMNQRVSGGDLEAAAELGRRYLEVSPRPERCTGVKLELAAILAQTGAAKEAARLYRQVADGAGPALEQQNALAFLARLERRTGTPDRALEIWQTSIERFPHGIHAGEALVELVRSTCGADSAEAAGFRRALKAHGNTNDEIGRLLKRCAPE